MLLLSDSAPIRSIYFNRHNTVGSTERYSNVTQISVRQIFFLDKITEILVRQFFLNVSSK